jgi:3-deoxy-manno-octulosonate cytidylyltransferase (CMP-KDO synthetase)
LEALSSEVVYKHVGIYAYRFDFLKRFCLSEPAGIERAESLEQLRALYMGAKIKVIKIQGKAVGVDTLEDVRTVEEILKNEKN